MKNLKINSSFKSLAILSHSITMFFGIALGMTICITYQHFIGLFLYKLLPYIIFIIATSIILRVYFILAWKKMGYNSISFNDEKK
tara:strand:- start:18 stop:272 length:255 start_codon:yes stop_codon:yes gene_type:complete